ncbi:MAG: hypothetical protein K2I23_02655, partial [Clostridia bacterium]|nr:hypothetical protein [Clostridia bacterium]
VKAKKQTDITIQAIRNINLADAAVSVLALQTSMFHTFGENDEAGFESILNGFTGAIVCALVFALGIYMIVKSQKRLKIELANKGVTPTEDNGREDNNQDAGVEGE